MNSKRLIFSVVAIGICVLINVICCAIMFFTGHFADAALMLITSGVVAFIWYGFFRATTWYPQVKARVENWKSKAS